MISAVEHDDDEVVILYLLGSILNRAKNETSLPINVIAIIMSLATIIIQVSLHY